jgi:hypothetical protein
MAFEIILNFNTGINASMQVGDNIYFTPTTPQGSSSVPYSSSGTAVTIELGKIVGINITSPTSFTIKVLTDLVGSNGGALTPSLTDFISFGKDNTANVTSLIGYYMEVMFVNDSKKKVELFSVGAMLSESSK